MYLKLVIAFVLVVISSTTDLPSFIKKCRYGDVECIVKSATAIRNYPTAFYQLGFTQFDPFRLDKLILDESRDNTVDMKLTLTNNSLFGLSQMTAVKAVGWTKDAATSKFELYGNIPVLNFTGNYNVDGRILFLPIRGDGEYTVTLTDILCQVKFKPIVEVKNGKQYLKIKKLQMRIDPAKFYIKVSNLFNGNENLGNSLNEVINNNWRDAWDEVAPALYEINEVIARNNLQLFFNRFAYEDLFLPDE